MVNGSRRHADPPLTTRTPPWIRAIAGPLLIVASVLVMMHGFWLSPKLTNQQVDLLAFWFPRFCAMGSSLAHGHIPTWLPNQFGGVPFASDPQSGWLYLPVMALFTTLSCVRAFGWFIVLQPALAGLGLFWFFRNEGLGRPASAVGGLTLALTMTGSVVALSLPFAGMLAWTALSLAGASGFVHARSGRCRLGWFAFIELALSQIAAAHLTDGLLIGAGVVALYLAARLFVQVRSGERRPWPAVAVGVAVFAAFPLLSAALLVPRLALLPRTPIGHGYLAAGRLANQLSGTSGAPPIYVNGVGPWWGTSFARGPGGYVGVLAILLIAAALASRRWRWPAAAFALAGFIGWVLNLDVLISSRRIRDFVLNHRIGELWLRSPYRFRYLLVIAFAALAGYGVQAWLDMSRAGDRRTLLTRTAWLAGPIVVFGLAPLVAGARLADEVPFAIGLAWAMPVLLLVARGRTRLAAVVPALVAVELTVVGLVAQLSPVAGTGPDRLEAVTTSGLGHSFPKFHAPSIDPAAYLTPGPIGRALIASEQTHSRYLTFNPGIARGSPRGFLFHQGEGDWPAYENGRSIVFGLEEMQGYSPVQEERYWRLVRFVDRLAPIYYNSSTFQTADLRLLHLFAAEWVIQPSRLPPPAGDARSVAREGRYTLYRTSAAPRASLATSWLEVPPGTGLRRIAGPQAGVDFAMVESPAARVPRVIGSSGLIVTFHPASYSELSPEHVRVVETWTPGAALLVIRNAWDPNWHATIDGKRAPVLIADYLMQGVQVPPGRHTVDVYYRDTAIGKGLLISAVAWFVLLGAWVVSARRRKERTR